MTPHLPCYQGFAVDDYGFTLNALNLEHHARGGQASTFAQPWCHVFDFAHSIASATLSSLRPSFFIFDLI